MGVVQRFIEVSFDREVIHCFPGAATSPALATGDASDVSFLASMHRHIVRFHVRVNVDHNDREIEFIQLKRFCQATMPGDTHAVGESSMEMLAERLLEKLQARYPGRAWEIRAFEDGENGAIIKAE